MPENALGDTAEKNVFEARTAMGAHDDVIVVSVFGAPHDAIPRSACIHCNFDFDFGSQRFGQFPHAQFCDRAAVAGPPLEIQRQVRHRSHRDMKDMAESNPGGILFCQFTGKAHNKRCAFREVHGNQNVPDSHL